MGSHNWMVQCPYCGFDEMPVSSCDTNYFEMGCPICGYARWTEEKVPDNYDVKLAKHKLVGMSTEEKQKAAELYYEDKIALVSRLKKS
jgi:hypothetical protein